MWKTSDKKTSPVDKRPCEPVQRAFKGSEKESCTSQGWKGQEEEVQDQDDVPGYRSGQETVHLVLQKGHKLFLCNVSSLCQLLGEKSRQS